MLISCCHLTQLDTAHDDYYNFNEVQKGVKIYDLWDYVHDNMKDACVSFAEEFSVSSY